MNFRKFRRNIKAISPVISVLLMIAVAVVASLVAYAWVMGYIGFQTNKTGQAVQIQSVAFADNSDGTMAVSTIYLQNIGSGAVTVDPSQSVYIEGIQVASYTGPTTTPIPSPSPTSVGAGDTVQINLNPNYGKFTPGTTITVKVTTDGGTYSQISQVVPEP